MILIDIQNQIVKIGKELFSLNGYKKTSISDITKKTGIATGSFYKYFSSKEELFLSIYLEENKIMQKKLSLLIDHNEDPIKNIIKILHNMISFMDTNPILKVFFDREQFNKIIKKIKPEVDQKHFEYCYELFNPFLEKGKSEDKIKDIDFYMFIALINSIFYVYAHKEDIGKDHFPQLLNFIIESIAEKLKT
ncbi:TetR/AcrR family transcriptional regulator [Clostridiaceae bacterium M8S5]|nr:TetR/AcrR family transcriptional regulator [Clostridiaceae bacterium M8S5]